jgi:hypothetical protein
MRSLTLCLMSCLLLPPSAAAASPVGAAVADGELLVARRRRGKRRRVKKVVKKVAEPVEAAPAAKPEPAPEPAPVTPTPPTDVPDEKPGLAVLDMKLASGIDPGVGSILNETLIAKLDDSGHFGRIIAGSDMRDMISLEQQKVALGCEAESCLAELGGALGVPYMFVTDLGRFGGRFIVNMKLLAVEESRVLARANKIVADEAAVLEALPEVMHILLGKAAQAGAFGDPPAAVQPVIAKSPKPVVAPEPADRPKAQPAAPAEKPAVVVAAQPVVAPAVTLAATTKPLLARPGFWMGTGLTVGGASLISLLPSMRTEVEEERDEYMGLEAGESSATFEREWSDFESARSTYNVLSVAAPVVATSGGVMLIYAWIWGG